MAEVEADRLHHLERHVLREDVGRCQHTGVLLDHRRGRRCGAFVEVTLERRPDVLAVLHEIRRRVDGVDRVPRALRDVLHVLLVEGEVVPRAEPAHVAADEVLPRVGKSCGGGRDVALDVLGEVALVDGRPARVDDVHEHERVVVGQVDEDVVGRVIRAVPRQLDTFASDLESAAVLKGLFGSGPCGVVVPQQELPGLLVPYARDAFVEQR